MSAGTAERQILIILGSARSNGDTGKAASALLSRLGSDAATLVDLGSKRILPFDYSVPDQSDDFSEVAELMIAHRSLVFATPVYWYAMSGRMKTLFDRFSDLLSGRDPARRGRALAGREAWLLAVGTDPDLPDGFERPFQMTADYLGMNWRKGFYVRSGKAADEAAIERLASELSAAA